MLGSCNTILSAIACKSSCKDARKPSISNTSNSVGADLSDINARDSSVIDRFKGPLCMQCPLSAAMHITRNNLFNPFLSIVIASS